MFESTRLVRSAKYLGSLSRRSRESEPRLRAPERPRIRSCSERCTQSRNSSDGADSGELRSGQQTYLGIAVLSTAVRSRCYNISNLVISNSDCGDVVSY